MKSRSSKGSLFTGEVFGSTEVLEKFLKLRVQYLFHVISSACASGTEFVLTDATKDQLHFFSELHDKLNGNLDKFAAFDNILSANDWGVRWSEVLKSSHSETDLLKQISSSLRIPEADADEKAKTQAAENLLEALRNRGKASVPNTETPDLKDKDTENDENAPGKTEKAKNQEKSSESSGISGAVD